MLSAMASAYHNVLRFTSECSFDDDFPLTKTVYCRICEKTKLCRWVEDPLHVLEKGNFKTWMCDDCYTQGDKEGTEKFEAEFKKRLKNGTLSEL